jgi:hypothetical protein
VLAKFNMTNAKPLSVPFKIHFKLSNAQCFTTDEDKKFMSKIPYDKAVGSLMYLMTCTRPDISLAIGKVSRYMPNPCKVNWKAVKWILRYLKGTKDVGLLFNGSLNNAKSFIGYVDADYGQDLERQKSTTRYIFTLGGGCKFWRSTLQKYIFEITTEAEYVVALQATKKAIWLESLSRR